MKKQTAALILFLAFIAACAITPRTFGRAPPATQVAETSTAAQLRATQADLSNRETELAAAGGRLNEAKNQQTVARSGMEEAQRNIRWHRSKGFGDDSQQVTEAKRREDEWAEQLKSNSAAARSVQQEYDALNATVDGLRERRDELLKAVEAEAKQSGQADLRDFQDRLDGLSQRPDAVKALNDAIIDAQAESVVAQYAAAQRKVERMRLLVEQNRGGNPLEVATAEAEAARLLSQYKELRLRAALDRVKQERGAFADRNPAPGEVSGQVLQTEFFRGYLDLVARYRDLSDDPLQAKVAAVVTAADVLREQGPAASIAFFEPMASHVDDPAVERLVRLQLAEAYLAAGQRDRALEQYRRLITGDAGDETPPGLK